MSLILFTDNASSLLASGILSTDTTLTVTATQGALFPAPGAGQIAKITLEDTSGNIEIVHCSGRTGDTMTVVRAQEGTTAAAFASGSRVELRCTAGDLQAMLQKNGGDTMTGSTAVNGVIQLGSSGSIQGGEYTGFLRSGAGVTAGQMFVSGGQPKSGTATILTSANAQATLPAGQSLVLTGMILFWNGTIGAIPSGWHICDGTSGTPDLRDKFIVGGNGALPVSGTYSAATGNATVAGSLTMNPLSLGMIPSHVHPFDYAFAGATAVIGIPGFSLPSTAYLFGGSTTGTRVAFAGSPNTGNGAAPPTGTFTDSTGHTHTQSIPYRGVFAIMKT